MKIRVTVELGKRERRLVARWRNQRFGESGRIASRKQCKEALLAAVNLFLETAAEPTDEDAMRDEGGD
ncbi:MAG: hypothetical protein KA072_04030 [Thermoanaerobaculaceae bacterium]|nr:hypothetical protein [Thermoanaerobaculaceae bacterium]MDI9622650.1 hypothetical protein [Acidobacteriota bacterium]NLH10511.1 hypothetical protein [Holophagae bacterium]HPW54601.1 hypothetical protein [Thermoanaerobaculaceae bacterium]